MADTNMHVLELLSKLQKDNNLDFLREGLQGLVQSLMEAHVSQLCGAALHERSEDRCNHRNGYRERRWDTRAGTLELQIPRLRTGSYFPPFLEARRRSEKAMLSVVQEAYIHGVSTRKVEDLVASMGIANMDKSQVSRMCKELDEHVKAFRNRPLDNEYVYLWLDATYTKIRENGHVISVANVIALAVNAQGERDIIGVDVGLAESEAFWVEFLRSLVVRGLRGVRLVISDCHVGLRKAISTVLAGCAWQRCRVHFMRNVLSKVPRSYQSLISSGVKSIFMQPTRQLADEALSEILGKVQSKFPQVAAMLIDCQEDVLAYLAFPQEHWSKIHSTNPLERLNKEIKRRSDVIGIFPNRAANLRLVGALLVEQNDEWSVSKRYLPERTMKKLLDPANAEEKQLFPDQRGILGS